MKMKIKILILCSVALGACQRQESSSRNDAELAAKNADTETCAACGMVVREQPAPRGQVIRRDGSREFLCSIDDLVRFLEVPSPSGKPRKVFTEVMAADHELKDLDSDWRPWDDVGGVFFVIGIKRRGVMGQPALTYRTKSAAEKAARNFGGRVISFDQLRQKSRK